MTVINRLPILFTLILSLLAFTASGTIQPNLRFTALNNQHGLSALKVNAIVQDGRGFMWIATDDGLNRFDGYEFKTYRPDGRSQDALIDHQILDLLVDRQGVLWVASSKGLMQYQPRTDRFIHFPFKRRPAIFQSKPGYFAYIRITKPAVAGHPNQGLVQFNPVDQTYVGYPPVNQTANAAAQNTIRDIVQSRDGPALGGNPRWVALPQARRYPVIPLFPARPTPPDLQLHCCFGHKRRATVDSTAKGLESPEHNDRQSACFHRGFGIKQYSNHRHFPRPPEHPLGDTFNGVNRFDPLAKRFIPLKSNPGNPFSIKGRTFSTVFQDHSGILWFGSADAGISLLDRHSNRFGHYNTTNLPGKCLSGNGIYAAFMDPKQNLWLASWGTGLHKIHWPSKTCRHYRADPAGLSNHSISALYVDRNETCGLA